MKVCNAHLLTHRERQIIECLAQGWTTKEIAGKLYISHHTVDSHRKNVCTKLGAKSSFQLGACAERLGLIIHDFTRPNQSWSF